VGDSLSLLCVPGRRGEGFIPLSAVNLSYNSRKRELELFSPSASVAAGNLLEALLKWRKVFT